MNKPLIVEPHWLLVLGAVVSIMTGHPLGIIVGVGLIMVAWASTRNPQTPKNP